MSKTTLLFLCLYFSFFQLLFLLFFIDMLSHLMSQHCFSHSPISDQCSLSYKNQSIAEQQADYWICNKRIYKIIEWAREVGKQECDHHSPTAKNLICSFCSAVCSFLYKLHGSIVFAWMVLTNYQTKSFHLNIFCQNYHMVCY